MTLKSEETPVVSEVPKKPKAHRVSKKAGVNVKSEKTDDLESAKSHSDKATSSQTESSMQVATRSTTEGGFAPQQDTMRNLETSSSEAAEASPMKEVAGALERVSTNVIQSGVTIFTF